MVYLSLGSNLGDRETNLETAIAALSAGGLTVQARSSIFETAPQDLTNQPWFLNLCVAGVTALAPSALLSLTRSTEFALGRRREDKALRGGPRLIDIDILLYGDEVIATPDLTVPHPRMLQRRFVLQPLLEIAPDLLHPVTRGRLRDYLGTVLSQPIRRL